MALKNNDPIVLNGMLYIMFSGAWVVEPKNKGSN
jgi:hypothetical protein